MGSVTTSPVSRRSLAKGAAWSIPAVAVAASAPAVAASVQRQAPYADISVQTSWNRDWSSNTADGSQAFKIFTSQPTDSKDPSTALGAGACVSNTIAGDTIENVTLIFDLPDANLTFTRSSFGSPDWTIPIVDTSTSGYDIDGVHYTPYSTTYAATITATTGSTCLPAMAFESNSGVTSTGFYGSGFHLVINGRRAEGSAPQRDVLTA